METGANVHKNRLYPVFLKLEQLNILLVGAGNVGLEKLASLLGNAPDATITVIAPLVKKEVRDLLKNHPACILIERAFELTDLEKKELIFLATDDPQLHGMIKQAASEAGILVNVADTPDLCDFYLGSIVQKGSLKIAISTNGKSPTVEKRLKEILNDLLPDEIDGLLDNLQTIRNGLKGNFQEKVKQLNELTSGLVTTTTNSKNNVPTHEA
jgi:siroheme synthase-like protein